MWHVKKKVKVNSAYSSLQLASPLWELTCHIGSHSLNCHMAKVTSSPLHQPKLVTPIYWTNDKINIFCNTYTGSQLHTYHSWQRQKLKTMSETAPALYTNSKCLTTFFIMHSQVKCTLSLCVCLSLAVFLHFCMYLNVTLGNGRVCPLVVHYCADLQSVYGFRCYGNICA